MTLSIKGLHNAEYRYAECRDIFFVKLNVVMVSVVLLDVVTLTVLAPD
jgi:hypothetical protein